MASHRFHRYCSEAFPSSSSAACTGHPCMMLIFDNHLNKSLSMFPCHLSKHCHLAVDQLTLIHLEVLYIEIWAVYLENKWNQWIFSAKMKQKLCLQVFVEKFIFKEVFSCDRMIANACKHNNYNSLLLIF